MSKPFNDRGPFAVGEVCRIVSADSSPELIGVEVKIVAAPREMRDYKTGEVWIGYETDLRHDGFIIAPEERQLRRRRPPSDSHERTYMEKWRDMASKAPQREGVPA